MIQEIRRRHEAFKKKLGKWWGDAQCTSQDDHDIEALLKHIDALERWKAEAMTLLNQYDTIAESVGSELGSNKLPNLERWVRARL